MPVEIKGNRRTRDRRTNNSDIKRMSATGLGLFDEQNRFLLVLLKELKYAQESKRSVDFILGMMSCLEQSILHQFGFQEELMQKSNYSDREKHIEAHREFILQYFTQTKQKLSKNQPVDFDEIIVWFATHIYHKDKTMSKHLKERLAEVRRNETEQQ
jgi:hemerythrin-like metal-binding protein